MPLTVGGTFSRLWTFWRPSVMSRLFSVRPKGTASSPRQQSRSAAGRTLPLARPVRSVPQDVVFGIARVDSSSRICERAVITALAGPAVTS